MKPIAAQMYSLRREAQADFFGTLRRVADIGYVGVQVSGLHGYDPAQLGEFIRSLGLQICSSHTDMPTNDNFEQIVKTEQSLGNTTVISGFPPDIFSTMAGCREAAATFANAASLLKPYGMSFGFHNHWGEFFTVDDRLAYDVLMEEAPDVFGELDVYWAAFGGADPAQVIRKYGDRLPFLHIKDGTLEKGVPMTAVGSGVLDIPSIINASNEDVLQWIIVELDEYAGDMFEAMEKSYEYLTSNNLAYGNK